MSRAPFQILVLLRRWNTCGYEYLLLKRADMGVWQGVAGGGEGDETPEEAAVRETFEETGILVSGVVDLQSVEMLPVLDVAGFFRWGVNIREIPEYAFCADVSSDALVELSAEHTDCRWLNAEEAIELLKWESNKRAIRISEEDPMTGGMTGDGPDVMVLS